MVREHSFEQTWRINPFINNGYTKKNQVKTIAWFRGILFEILYKSRQQNFNNDFWVFVLESYKYRDKLFWIHESP